MKNRILGALRMSGISVDQFARLCGESKATVYRHLNDPDKITLKELKILRRYANTNERDLHIF